MEIEMIENCPVCGSAETKLEFQSADKYYRLSPHIFNYNACLTCNAIFLSDRPAETNINAFYPDDYSPYGGNSASEVKRTLARKIYVKISALPRKILEKIFNYRKDVRLAQLYANAKDILIDYGCGSYKFLSQAKRYGWNPIGIDFNESVIENIKAHGHTAYKVDDNLYKLIPDHSIDVIRLNHVFEHIYHPDNILRFIYAKLKPGGQVHIAMPNPKGISSLLFRNNWFSLDSPRHIILYPPNLIGNMLKENGFGKIDKIGEYINKDMIRSIGYILINNRLMAHEKIYNMYLMPFWDLVTIPLLIVSWFARKPDRYHIIATKNG